MGDLRNNLRHHGMLATSGSWRRHWPIARTAGQTIAKDGQGRDAVGHATSRAPTIPLAGLLLALLDAWRRIGQASMAHWLQWQQFQQLRFWPHWPHWPH